MIKENLFLWFILFLLIVSPSFLFGAVGIIVLIFLAIILFGAISLFLFRRKIRKMAEQAQRAQGQQGQHTQQGDYTSTGGARSGDPEVRIFRSKKEKKVSSEVGDYVDFEEVEE